MDSMMHNILQYTINHKMHNISHISMLNMMHNMIQNIMHSIMHNMMHSMMHTMLQNMMHNMMQNKMHNMMHNMIHNIMQLSETDHFLLSYSYIGCTFCLPSLVRASSSTSFSSAVSSSPTRFLQEFLHQHPCQNFQLCVRGL